MMGIYYYDGVDDKLFSYSIITDINLLILNVIATNYLIAMLSTVYEDMIDKGDFDFKCIKY